MIERLQWGILGAVTIGALVGIIMLFSPGSVEAKLTATGVAAAFGFVLGMLPLALFSLGLLGGGDS
jgi:hypothetical protein